METEKAIAVIGRKNNFSWWKGVNKEACLEFSKVKTKIYKWNVFLKITGEEDMSKR